MYSTLQKLLTLHPSSAGVTHGPNSADLHLLLWYMSLLSELCLIIFDLLIIKTIILDIIHHRGFFQTQNLSKLCLLPSSGIKVPSESSHLTINHWTPKDDLTRVHLPIEDPNE
jgi:hypothetical protein